MMGEPGSGKTTIINSMYDGGWNVTGHKDCAIKTVSGKITTTIAPVRHEHHKLLDVRFFDAGGDVLKGYGPVLEQYYANSRGGFLVYDAQHPGAFENVT